MQIKKNLTGQHNIFTNNKWLYGTNFRVTKWLGTESVDSYNNLNIWI